MTDEKIKIKKLKTHLSMGIMSRILHQSKQKPRKLGELDIVSFFYSLSLVHFRILYSFDCGFGRHEKMEM